MTDVSVDTTLLAPARQFRAPRIAGQSIVVGIAAALLATGAFALALAFSLRQGVLLLLGGALGLVLHHALFGFASSWRAFVTDGRGAGLRAQFLMIAVAAVLFIPALAGGTLFGHPLAGAYGPVGVSVAVGAFLFGIGMQIAGGCATGTLYSVGGGSTRMLATLATFIIGATLGAYHFGWWASLPTIGAVSLIKQFGWLQALAATLAVLALLAALTATIERRWHGRLGGDTPVQQRGWRRVLRGPWPLLAAAVLLALGNVATLAIAGRPWGVINAFSLWGSKIIDALGGDVVWWDFWQARPEALEQSVFADVQTVMNVGLILGALLAAGLAGKFAPTLRMPVRSLIAALLGGLLMGYGARLAYGCTIGAFFSGVASGSLHGWVWFVLAVLGSVVGIWLRPLFGLAVKQSSANGA